MNFLSKIPGLEMLLVGIILFFLLREVFTWYWKINRIVVLLEKIEQNTRPNTVAGDQNTTGFDLEDKAVTKQPFSVSVILMILGVVGVICAVLAGISGSIELFISIILAFAGGGIFLIGVLIDRHASKESQTSENHN
ncbi:MAG: hypothetical protein KA104_00240 [Candidatus Pacebacteria bacterium]|jgi:hypothetical protein|nr:hypothetical protein [Candidatus Paceibacterota bacterium]